MHASGFVFFKSTVSFFPFFPMGRKRSLGPMGDTSQPTSSGVLPPCARMASSKCCKTVSSWRWEPPSVGWLNTFCWIKFTRKIVTSWISWRAEKGGWVKTYGSYGTMFGDGQNIHNFQPFLFQPTRMNRPRTNRPWKRCFFYHVKNPTFSGWNLWKPSSGCVNPNVPVWWFPKIEVPPVIIYFSRIFMDFPL